MIPCIFATMLTMLKPPDFHEQLIISPTPKVLRTGRRSCGSQRLLGTGTKWNFRKFVSNNKRVVKKPDMFKNVSADFS